MDINAQSAKISREDCPWLVFKLHKNQYALNSEHVVTILILPRQLDDMPESPSHIRGIFNLRGEIIPLLELRVLFGEKSLDQEYNEFVDMIEHRKQDHLTWAQELESCAKEKRPFTLATDPHKCAFGRWYDNFETDIHSVKFHLAKIDEPHKKLHAAALEVQGCSGEHSTCNRAECLNDVFIRVKSEYVPKIVSILDEAKNVMKSNFREMVIVLEGTAGKVGVIVDEVLSVQQLKLLDDDNSKAAFSNANYVLGASESSGGGATILVLDELKLFSLMGQPAPA